MKGALIRNRELKEETDMIKQELPDNIPSARKWQLTGDKNLFTVLLQQKMTFVGQRGQCRTTNSASRCK